MDTSGRTVLGAAGGATEAQAKQMFGKEEMAAILRFGAEELFRGEGDEAHEERVGQAVMEEELDAILARAEVSGTDGWSSEWLFGWVGREEGKMCGGEGTSFHLYPAHFWLLPALPCPYSGAGGARHWGACGHRAHGRPAGPVQRSHIQDQR